MPRLLAGGPGLGVSLDQNWIAVAGSGRLSLVDATTRKEASASHLPAEETDVLFAHAGGAPRVLAFTRRGDATDVRSFSLPGLELSGQLEMTGTVKPMAVVGDRVLVATEAGEHARMLIVAPKVLVSDPIALREPVQLAVGAPEDRLLVSARDQVECWDPQLRRALYRLNLPVAKPKQAGFSARRRLLWVASGGPQGQIEVYRFSDGRLQLRIDLGKRFVAGDGHGESSRIVVAIRGADDHPIELVEYDLTMRERRVVPAPTTPASYCVVEGASPTVVTVDSDARVGYVPLQTLAHGEPPADASVRPPRSATPAVAMRVQGNPPSRKARDPLAKEGPAAAAAPAAGASATQTASGLPSWRARLGNTDRTSTATAEAVSLDAEPPAEAPAAEPPKAAPAPPMAIGRITPMPRPVERPMVSRVADVPAPVHAEPNAPASAFVAGLGAAVERERAPDSWRDPLVAWGVATLAAPHSATPPPVDDRSELAQAIDRFSLDLRAATGLSLLYASWLVGDGERGVAAATVAQALAVRDGQSAVAWTEALGRGVLARAGLVRPRRGRLRLAGAVGRFLDGGPTLAERERVLAPAYARASGPHEGVFRVALPDEEWRKGAERVALKLGRTVAVLEADAPRLGARLLAARLAGAVPLICGEPTAVFPSPPTDGAITLLGHRGYCPEALEDLPLLEIDHHPV